VAQQPASISRKFAQWGSGLQYADLPEAVVDKIKALTLMAVVAGLIGADSDRAQRIVALVESEESRPDGASVFGGDATLTRMGAALANCEIMHVAGLFDSYRMLTHPGPVLVSVALTTAELGAKNGAELITALASGYEVQCRIAHDFIPAIAAQGFRPSPLLSTLGAAVVAAKLMDLDEEATVAALAIAANSCSGLNEAGRSGGGEIALHEINAARQGTFAAVMASLGEFRGSEQIIEGASGFYRAYAGRTGPTISHVFTGSREVDLTTVTDGLGSVYKLSDIMFRMYKTAGYNQPVIDLIAELRVAEAIDPTQIEEIIVTMNYLETQYPSPEFPSHPDPTIARAGSTQYFAAHAAVHGGFPVVGAEPARPLDADPEVVALMARVSLRGVYNYPMFSPHVVIRMHGGLAHAAQYPYSRMVWNFEELALQLRRCADGIPGGRPKLDAVVGTVRRLPELESVAPLFALARP
jgi:2-methylcitrate dehydratase PrpD